MKKDIDELPKNAANYTALTPLWFLERAAKVHPNRKSLIHESCHYTWHQTYQRCCRFASALSNYSIGLGNTVMLFFPPSISSLFLILTFLTFTLLYHKLLFWNWISSKFV